MNKIIINLVRLFFIGLIGFEFLNYLNILNFELDFTWLGLVVTGAAVWVGLEIIHYFLKKRNFALHLHPALWCAALLVVCFDALGDIFHFYGRFIWYDQVAHFLGAAVAGLIIFSIIQTANSPRTNKIQNPLMSLLTFAIVTTLGAFYEFEEYLEDLFNYTNRLGDGLDTANDMLLNVLGVLTIIAIITMLGKIKDKKDPKIPF